MDASTTPSNPGYIGIAACATSRKGVRWFTTAFGGYGTSNYGELLALAFALECIRPSINDEIVMCSDSTFAVQAAHRVGSCHQELAAPIRSWLSRLPGCHVIHRKGHDGEPGNEAADFHAYAASIHGQKGCWVPVYVPPFPGLEEERFVERDLLPRYRELCVGDKLRLSSLHYEIVGSHKLSATSRPLVGELRRKYEAWISKSS